MDQERLSLLALYYAPGIGDKLLRQLIAYCGSAEQVFKIPKGKLLKIPGIGPVSVKSIKNKDTFNFAEKELIEAEKKQVQILAFTDRAFPGRLKAIEDAPVVLYTKGNVNLNCDKIIGIVGTRKATPYGKSFVERVIRELVPHQPLIVSGLAYGIDIHAHKEALKSSLNTVGVLGSGLDQIYPAAHEETARKMLSNGGLISEHAFGTKPDAHNFPARNRIIAGLCDALIVAEAALTGGALITADIANTYNKDVFALPGNYEAEYSAGCNWLIKTNKANLITSVKDIEYIMNWSTDGDVVKSENAFLDNLTPAEIAIIEAIKNRGNSIAIDELTIKTLLSPGALANNLLALELKGLVKSLPGKSYKLA